MITVYGMILQKVMPADFVLAKQSLLDQEQELSRSWKEDTFNMPVVIAPTTFNKSTIGKRYYKH